MRLVTFSANGIDRVDAAVKSHVADLERAAAAGQPLAAGRSLVDLLRGGAAALVEAQAIAAWAAARADPAWWYPGHSDPPAPADSASGQDFGGRGQLRRAPPRLRAGAGNQARPPGGLQ